MEINRNILDGYYSHERPCYNKHRNRQDRKAANRMARYWTVNRKRRNEVKRLWKKNAEIVKMVDEIRHRNSK